MQIKIRRVHVDAIIPEYATAGAACFDLHTINPLIVRAGDSEIARTGLAFEMPPGYVMLVHSRSGHGFKNSVRLANCTGVIDSDYRGEVMIKLHNDHSILSQNKQMVFQAGDRIAQAMLVPVMPCEFVEGELTQTDRGEGGFGSTGQ